jgi:prepilin-type N-terminal cleavage/methylation domain-containing protein
MKSKLSQRKVSIFSLVELLIVISILAVLMSLLTPTLRKSIYYANALQCKENLKSISLGVLLYSEDNNDYYPTGDPTTSTYEFIRNRAYKALLHKVCMVTRQAYI